MTNGLKAKTRRIDLLLLDLDETVWNGTLGEATPHTFKSSSIPLINKIIGIGIIPVIVTNTEKIDEAWGMLESVNLDKNCLAGIIQCKGPKILVLDKILERMGVPWDRVAAIDDDPVVQEDYVRRGSMCFSSISEAYKYDWFVSNSPVTSDSRASRLTLRKAALELVSASKDMVSSTATLEYLKDKDLRIKYDFSSIEILPRVIELFHRTVQLQFNRSYFKQHDRYYIRNALQRFREGGGKIVLVNISMGGLDLGLLGVVLLGETPTGTPIIENATFSCTIIPFKIVEILSLLYVSNHVNKKSSELFIKTSLSKNNLRVSWLLEDIGAIKYSEDRYVIDTASPIPNHLKEFIFPTLPELTEYGIPSIAEFFDDEVFPRIVRENNYLNVLDIGYGYGECLGHDRNMLFEREISILGGNLTKADLIPQDSATKQMDVQNMETYNGNNFTTVICLELLEHVRHPEKAVSELLRVLKNDGLLFLTVPGPIYPYHEIDIDISRFTCSFWINLLESIGKILKMECEKIDKQELRTLLCFQLTESVDYSSVRDYFNRNCLEGELPNGLNLYDSI